MAISSKAAPPKAVSSAKKANPTDTKAKPPTGKTKPSTQQVRPTRSTSAVPVAASTKDDTLTTETAAETLSNEVDEIPTGGPPLPPSPPPEPTLPIDGASPNMTVNEIDMAEAIMDTSLNPTPAEAAARADKEPTATNDEPDAQITQHIAGLSVLDDPKSPAKKKSKKSTTSDGKRKSSKVSPNPTTATTTPNPSSILKSSRTTPSKPPYNHVFKRVIIEASVILEEEAERERYAEFKNALGTILTNMILVDDTAEMVPISPQTTAPSWLAPKHVPSNMTEVGKFVFISSTPWRFKTKSQKRGDNAIYFSFTISSDVPPSEICSGIIMEWCRQNGERMVVKTVQDHDTITPILIFFLWNEGPPDLFIQELRTALTQCWEYGLARFDTSLPPAINLPELALVRKFPQVKGASTAPPPAGTKPNKQLQDSRRVLHIEVGRKYADLLRRLVDIGKGIHVFSTMWGRQIHLSEMLEPDAPNEARMALNKMAQDHSLFIFGSRVERLIGITMLDWKVATKSATGEVTGKFSLRDILLNHLQTKEAKQVIGSIHQCGIDEPFVIVQNSADIESFLGRMNHQLPAFLGKMLEVRYPSRGAERGNYAAKGRGQVVKPSTNRRRLQR